MPHPTQDQIGENVRQFAEGTLQLDKFLEWFVPISWDIEKSNNAELIGLVHEIDGLLAESSSANWSEADLREVLAEAVGPFVPEEYGMEVSYDHEGQARFRLALKGDRARSAASRSAVMTFVTCPGQPVATHVQLLESLRGELLQTRNVPPLLHQAGVLSCEYHLAAQF